LHIDYGQYPALVGFFAKCLAGFAIRKWLPGDLYRARRLEMMIDIGCYRVHSTDA
jgi:hypothetical protein